MRTDADRARQLRRRRRHERQAVVFGGLIAAMAVAALGATAVYTGIVDAPFTREFTTLEPETPAAARVAPPCVPDETLPVAYTDITVRVLNGTSRAGLAGETANELTSRGFVVTGTDNTEDPVVGTAVVHVGPAGVAAGYTLAAHIEGARIQLDTREDGSVDLLLGSEWTEMIDPSTVPLTPDAPLTPVPDCVPVDEAVVTAGPPPVPLPTEEGAEGGSEPAADA